MLHGKVEINGHVIMEWQISNQGQNLTEDTDKYNYAAVVWGRDNRGYPYTYEWEWIDRGSAPYLVAKLMAGVNERLTEHDDWRLRDA